MEFLAGNLTEEFGEGFNSCTLREYRQFYLIFPNADIWRTVCAKLSYSRLIIRLTDKKAQTWYLREAAENNWTVRTLDRNISTLYYQRLLSSQLKEPIIQEMKNKAEQNHAEKLEFIKNPTVVEFLGLPGNSGYTEVSIGNLVKALPLFQSNIS